MTAFARAFGDARTGAVSPSTISRWENGLVPLTRAAISRYEQLLGAEPYSLVSVVETLARYYGRGSAPAALPDARRRLDELTERVLGDGLLSGTEWDELTVRLTSGPVVVAPRSFRAAVCERLLAEMIVAGGLSWMRRFESLGRLLAHPGWAEDAIAACAVAASDPHFAGLIEAVCALDGSGHADASSYVVRQLTRPTNDDAFHGALLACVRKTRRRHFTHGQLGVVAGVVTDLLGDAGTRPAEAVLAAELVPWLGLPPAGAARLTRAAREHPAAHHVAEHGRLTAPDAADTAVARVLSRIPAADDPPGTGAVLRELVDEALHHPLSDVRLYTSMLLRASPYGRPFATAVAMELRSAATLRAPERAIPVLNALRTLGGPEQREAVMAITLADGLPAPVVQAAIHALGHIGGQSPERYWRQALRHHTMRRDRAPDGSDLKRLVYGIAMSGGLDLLRRLAGEEGMPVHALSTWWTNLPGHIQGSAQT